MKDLPHYKSGGVTHVLLLIASKSNDIKLPTKGNNLIIIDVFNYKEQAKNIFDTQIQIIEDDEIIQKAYQKAMVKKFQREYPKSVCLFDLDKIPSDWSVLAIDFMGAKKYNILLSLDRFMGNLREQVSQLMPSLKDVYNTDEIISYTSLIEKYRQLSAYLGPRAIANYEWILSGICNTVDISIYPELRNLQKAIPEDKYPTYSQLSLFLS